MLQIRPEQMQALSEAQTECFVDRMVEHIRKHFPQHYEAIGEDDTRLLVQHGIERSRQYGIVSERDVCKYIDLMLVHGPEFDTDSNVDWAQKTLNDKRLRPSQKVDRLFAETTRRLEQ